MLIGLTSKNVTKCGDLTVSVDGNFEIKSEGTSGLARCVCISSRRCHDHDRGRQSVTSPRQISLQSLHHLGHHHDDQMTLVRVLGSASPSEVRMTTWYGEQSGMESLLHNHPKNPNKIFGLV